MLRREDVKHAVELQVCGYQLLKWLEKATTDGFVTAETAHAYASLEEATRGWIDRHYLNIPPRARPRRGDLEAFCKLFSTYLASTFDFDQDPGYRLYSPDAHCFCPHCSWMVCAPHLTPKRIGAEGKKLATSLMRGCIRKLADELTTSISDDRLDQMVQASELREPLGLVAYTHDLLQRLEGKTVGTASLALWRSFAWTAQGSPKKGFILTTEMIMDAQDLLVGRILE